MRSSYNDRSPFNNGNYFSESSIRDNMFQHLKPFWWAALLSVGILGLVLLSNLLLSLQERKMVGAVVLEHNVTSDKMGSRTYSTIVKTDDGYVEEITGLQTYAIPVGRRIKFEVVRPKQLVSK